MTETRRLAAIVAIDVVGYSRLMGEDETGTAQAVRANRDVARPIVANLGGRIVKTMGDGVLLEFPSIVAAVECAVAVQELMLDRNVGAPENKRIVYRIGVHLGDVLIDGDDILGEGVNIAARLEGIAKPGSICLSASAFEHVRGRIEANFVDLGDKELKNIARPVRVYALEIGAEGAKTASITAPAHQGPPRLSIVVLPFIDMGGDAEQDYFVDGVTESLTTDLSRIGGSFVIARNTAFSYKGKAIDARQIGRDLGVRYVLEGSIQRRGGRLRVNAQLIDAETGAHLWAERFDLDEADLFELQDSITFRIARSLDLQFFESEGQRGWRDRPQNPDALDLAMRGWSIANKGETKDNLAEAGHLFDRALALDPDNVSALVGFAFCNALALTLGWTFEREETMRKAEWAAERSLQIDPKNARAHHVMTHIWRSRKNPEAALQAAERAVELNPSFANAYGVVALMKVYLGRAEEALVPLNDALRLSPRDPYVASWLFYLGYASLHLGRIEDAINYLSKAALQSPKFEFSHLLLAGAYALADRLDDAHRALSRAMAMRPGWTVKHLVAIMPSTNAAYLVGEKRIFDGLRKAGMEDE